MFISVIIPVYNVEKYIEECLNSILCQSIKDTEIICINDGSTDRSYEILKRYEELYPQIKVISQENKGLSEARNAGINMAQGAYLCFVDSDDMLTQDALNVIRDEILKHEDVPVFSYETKTLLYKEGIEKNPSMEAYYKICGRYDNIYNGRDLFVELIDNDDFVESACLLVVKRTWLEEKKIRFLSNALFEDSWFSLACYFEADKMYHINKGLYIYRIRSNSIMTANKYRKNIEWRLKQVANCIDYIYTKATNEEERNALEKYIEQLLRNIRGLYPRIRAVDREKIARNDTISRLLLNCIDTDYRYDCNKCLKTEGLLRRIEKANKVLVYGAGNVCGKLMNLLVSQQLDYKIVGIAVSKINDTVTNIYGKQLKQINCYNNQNIDLIIIASCNYHEAMLKNIGYFERAKIVLIDDEMESEIDVILEDEVYE